MFNEEELKNIRYSLKLYEQECSFKDNHEKWNEVNELWNRVDFLINLMETGANGT